MEKTLSYEEFCKVEDLNQCDSKSEEAYNDYLSKPFPKNSSLDELKRKGELPDPIFD